jgi:phage terminase Nu1 subunit (DNA packaging protein)
VWVRRSPLSLHIRPIFFRAYLAPEGDEVTAESEHATASVVAEHLDISRPRVGQLVKEGVLQRRRGGKFELDDCRRRYIRWLRTERRGLARSAAAQRLATARARDLELRSAQREGRLMEVEEHEAVLSEIIATIIMHLDGMPARFTEDLAQRARLDGLIGEVRNEVAAALSKAGAEYERRTKQ